MVKGVFQGFPWIHEKVNGGSSATESEVVKNVGVAVGILHISHYSHDLPLIVGIIHLEKVAFQILPNIYEYGNVGNLASESGMVENVGVAIGILPISHS